MNYFFFNSKVHYSINGYTGDCELGELNSVSQSSKGPVFATTLNSIITNKAVINVNDKTLLEATIKDTFEGEIGHGYALRHKEIGENHFQIYGIKEVHLEDIFSALNKKRLSKCVPYGYLMQQHTYKLFPNLENMLIALVDVIDEECYVTFFDNKNISETRKIIINNFSNLESELRLTKIDYVKTMGSRKNPDDIKYTVVTNDKSIADGLVDENYIDKEYVYCAESAQYLFIDALKQYSSKINFKSKEAMQNEIKRQELAKYLAKLTVCAAVALVGLVGYLYSGYLLHNIEYKYSQKSSNVSSLESILSSLTTQKYQSIISKDRIKMGEIYYSLIYSLPESYRVSAFKLSKNDNDWSGEIQTLMDDENGVYEDINLESNVVSNLQINNNLISDVPGKIIKFTAARRIN